MFTLFTTFPQVAQCLETLSTTHTQIYVGVVLPAAPNGHKIMVLSDWKTKLLANHHCDTGPCEDYGLHDPVLATNYYNY
jgi:hypothetical protein